jgi:cytochrome c5
MSDQHTHAEHHSAHEGPIKTPKQLIVAVVAAFIVPIFAIVLLVSYVSSDTKPGAGSELSNEQAVAARIKPVGMVEVKDASDASALKTGQEVFNQQCGACHTAGVAGAPKVGDAGAWAPRLGQGFPALLNSALKGKGAMGPQGGGDFSDVEIARAVVYMANSSGGKLEEPKVAAAAASAPEAAASK